MKIFLSYSWSNSKVADTISNKFLSLKQKNVEVLRDKERLTFMQDIKKFMQSIRESDYVIILISDEYLKSMNCMFEITELIKDTDFTKKILVLVDKKVDIINTSGINKYLLFWQDKCNSLHREVEKLDLTNQAITISDLRKAEDIKNKLTDFLQAIRNLNLIVFNENITMEDFNKIKRFLGFDVPTILNAPNVYYIINVPRTLSERNKDEGYTIIWWHKDSSGYTDDLRFAKIFTLDEANKKIIDNYNWGCRKFAAVPADIVASLGQNVVPQTDDFLSILLSEPNRIIGNKRIYLEKDEIRFLI